MNPIISDFKNVNDTLEFRATNINVSFINAIRRILLSEIPTVSFITFPNEKNDAVIHSNTSRFNNEILKQRLSCIPIHITDNTINVNNLVLNLKYKNDTSTTQNITTEYFKIWDESTNNYLSDEITKQIFPKNPITNNYILFLKLRPPFIQNKHINTNGEEIHLECRMSRQIAKTNSMFNVVSIATFSNLQLPKEAILQEFNKYKKDLTSKETYSDDELYLIEKDWYAINAKRLFIPDAFIFKLKTVGVFDNYYLLKTSCEIIINKLNNFITQTDSSLYQINPNNTFADNTYTIILYNEDYTLGKIIEYTFYIKYLENEEIIKYVTFKKQHPHDFNSELILTFIKPTEQLEVAEYFNNVSKDIIDIYTNIIKQIK